jgi:acyl carrier protein
MKSGENPMENETTTILNTVRQFIVDTFVFDPDTRHRLTDDLQLIDEGILDSFGVHETLLFLEEQFQIDVKDEEIVSGNLGSIAAITAYVQSKMPESHLAV